MTSRDLSQHSRAEVFDIQNPKIVLQKRILVDTNVLLFCYYDRWSISETIGDGVKHYQTREYPSFFKKLLSEKIDLYVHRIALTEFIRRIFIIEAKLLFCRYHDIEDLPNFNLKAFTHEHFDDVKRIRNGLLTYLAQLRKPFQLTSSNLSIEDFLSNTFREWQDSLSGISDSAMMAEAKCFGLDAVLSDDSDFVSFPKIKLYTANRIAINAFRKQGH